LDDKASEAPAHGARLLLIHGVDICTGEADGSFNAGRVWKEPKDGGGERALATATLANDREDFAGGDIEIDSPQCPGAAGVGDAKIAQREGGERRNGVFL